MDFCYKHFPKKHFDCFLLRPQSREGTLIFERANILHCALPKGVRFERPEGEGKERREQRKLTLTFSMRRVRSWSFAKNFLGKRKRGVGRFRQFESIRDGVGDGHANARI